LVELDLGDQLGAIASAAELASVLLVVLDLGDQLGVIASAAELAGVLLVIPRPPSPEECASSAEGGGALDSWR